MTEITGTDFYYLISVISIFGSLSVLTALFRRLF